MARLPDGTEIAGEKLGACVIVVTPKGLVFVEKPWKKNWGYEFPGGHGEPEDENLEECAERELLQETGIHADVRALRLIDEPRVKLNQDTSEVVCVTAMFLLQLPYTPKLKELGDGKEVVHLIKSCDLKNIKVHPPHYSYLEKVMDRLYASPADVRNKQN